MPDYIGIDTSNYTTSAAVFVSEEMKIYQAKKLLPVKKGELGLRQSDAVFHHTKQLPDMQRSCAESGIFLVQRQYVPQHVPEMRKAHICRAFCAEKALQEDLRQ